MSIGTLSYRERSTCLYLSIFGVPGATRESTFPDDVGSSPGPGLVRKKTEWLIL